MGLLGDRGRVRTLGIKSGRRGFQLTKAIRSGNVAAQEVAAHRLYREARDKRILVERIRRERARMIAELRKAQIRLQKLARERDRINKEGAELQAFIKRAKAELGMNK